MDSYGATTPEPRREATPAKLIGSGDRAGGDEGKVSGKAWGRVKNIFTRHGRFPTSIYFIIGNEFCERFSYYGMKTILVIYLTQRLGFHNDPATAVYHGFNMLCYFMPLFGAILADGYLGKYRTILYISLVYALGNVVMALTALPPPEWIGPMVGLVLIGVGTGGIKPCVSAFGGDQFSKEQKKEIQTFFSVFYFAINAGSLISTFLTPVLRADVQCFDADCYPLAFGVPAALMIASLIIFISGRKMYKSYPPSGNLFGKVFRCVMCGIKKKFTSKEKVEHWLDRTTDKFETNFVEDVKCLMRVLLLFLPLPVFWALFDQLGSRWTLQAGQMNGRLVDGWKIKPDQMQAINPVLILLLIPVFENFIYPLLDKCRIPNRPLQRMVAGMTLAVVAFVVAGFLQIRIDNLKEEPLALKESGFSVINTLPCQLSVKSTDLDYSTTIGPYELGDFVRHSSGNFSVTIATNQTCSVRGSVTNNINLESQKSYRIVLFEDQKKLVTKQFPDLREKPKKGNASVSFIFSLEETFSPGMIMLVKDKEVLKFNISRDMATDFLNITPGKYDLYIPDKNGHWQSSGQTVEMDYGAVYSIMLTGGKMEQEEILVHRFTSVEPNQVSMGYQVPQYIIITMAEVMFSITGLSFAYSQAPPSMKSVLQAAWLMTVAVGNLIVLIIAEVQLIPNQSAEFFLFAALMGLDVIIFAVMAIFYKYTNHVDPSTMEFSDTTGLVNNDQSDESSLKDK
ncbi:solute carrier family 15 member 2-like isoform X2 [Liolophura sinensis]|uniref:solute carrier family 15 member 2-like isoform X2 n=1 Tax=Liolophura sinensis TaxID=3198878 RepID=UPI003159944B